MIPEIVEAHLRAHYPAWRHHRHALADTAQELAAAEHVTGHRVAKAVVVKLDGQLAIAVVAATDRVNMSALEEATGLRAELVGEEEFTDRFGPCDAGADPPLAMFGAPIFADDRLIRDQPQLVMPAGTHEDAVVVDTDEWVHEERVQPIANLGARHLVPAAA